MIALSVDGHVTSEEFVSPTGKAYDIFTVSNKSSDLRTARSEFEKHYIKDALNQNEWNVEKTAIMLGITSRQLWNKIGQFGLKKDIGK